MSETRSAGVGSEMATTSREVMRRWPASGRGSTSRAPRVAARRLRRRHHLRAGLDPARRRVRLPGGRRVADARPPAAALPHRPDGVHRGPRRAARCARLGRAARPRHVLLDRPARRPRARWLAQRARRGDPQDDLRPRSRRARLGRRAHRRAPCGCTPPRTGHRRHRHPPLGPRDTDAPRVVRPGLVRLRGVPRRQRQHARPRGVHRDGARQRGCRVARTRPSDRRPPDQRRCARTGLAVARALHCATGRCCPTTTATSRCTPSALTARRSVTPWSGRASSSSSTPRRWSVPRRGSSRRPTV